MKLRKSFLAVLLALAMAGSSACGIIPQQNGGGVEDGTGQTETVTHSLTLNLNGGTLGDGENITSFKDGEKVVLPTPTRNGYKFAGWYDNEDCLGSNYSVINAGEATSDKVFWAKWESDSQESGNPEPAPTTYTVTLHFNGGSLVNESANVTSYTQGVAKNLPTAADLKLDGHTFKGWYDNGEFTGNAVTQIPANATGNKDYYAKWEKDEEEEPEPTPETYTVTFKYRNGTGDEVKSVTEGHMVAEPAEPSRTGYDFDGWYTSATGGTKFNFSQGITQNTELYARWIPKTYTVKLELQGGSFIDNSSNITSYTYGTAITLPVSSQLKYDGHTFDGWYGNAEGSGTPVTQISATDTGNKTYYAKWTEIIKPPAGLEILSYGGYEEGAYAEVKLLEGATVSDYTATYSGTSHGTVDSELIRKIDDTTVRIDIVGIEAGEYSIQISAKNNTVTASDITVTSYDRSGYAHFKDDNEGVGGYTNDGTPKPDAVIVYVTEETKNTVSAKLGSSNYKGLVKILNNASKAKAVIIRIIGTIGAPTWKEINYDKGGNYSDGTDYDGSHKLPSNKVIGKNNKQLPTDSNKLTQEELIKGGYNELDTSVYAELDGLTSKATYKSGEYDSAWNNCGISNVSNVTVEGIGTDARIFQWGFTWKSCNNIEIRNLTFEDYTEDACSFEGSKINVEDYSELQQFDSRYIWVHNNTFLEGKNYWDVCPEQDKHEGDGATDFKYNANITISYNHYFENHKTGLIGGGDTQITANVTFHHNWYEHCASRLPLARQANMHMYNNYYDRSTGTNMSIRSGAYAFIEYCYFNNANVPIETKKADDKDGGLDGYVKVFNCKFEGSKYQPDVNKYNIKIVSGREDKVSNQNIFNKNFDTDPTAFYYDSQSKKSGVSSLTTNVDKVPDEVKAVAGTHKNG